MIVERYGSSFFKSYVSGGDVIVVKGDRQQICRLKASAKLSSEVILQTVTLVMCYHASIAH